MMIEEAVFARVNGKWRLEGFFDDKELIADVKRHVDKVYGKGNFFSVALPSGEWQDDRFMSVEEIVDQSQYLPYMLIKCPLCQVEPGVSCETVSGKLTARPHYQRVRAASQEARAVNLLV